MSDNADTVLCHCRSDLLLIGTGVVTLDRDGQSHRPLCSGGRWHGHPRTQLATGGTEQGMKRLTQADWNIINAALAFYGADDLSEQAESHGMAEADYLAAVNAAHEKVGQRIQPAHIDGSGAPT